MQSGGGGGARSGPGHVALKLTPVFYVALGRMAGGKPPVDKHHSHARPLHVAHASSAPAAPAR
ncbi:hypothetical protein AB4141_20000 [Cupriavidus sp. 2KB_15]